MAIGKSEKGTCPECFAKPKVPRYLIYHELLVNMLTCIYMYVIPNSSDKICIKEVGVWNSSNTTHHTLRLP